MQCPPLGTGKKNLSFTSATININYSFVHYENLFKNGTVEKTPRLQIIGSLLEHKNQIGLVMNGSKIILHNFT